MHWINCQTRIHTWSIFFIFLLFPGLFWSQWLGLQEMSFESTTSLFFFAPPKMFKILKNESWFSEKLFELNLKSMESLKFFQKITSKTHIENTPKKKQKKKSVFSENWSNARCTSKYHFFAEISQKFHAFTYTFTFFI